jgi:hypothetical protein
MRELPTIDLHPQVLPASTPEIALAAAREFLRLQLQKRQAGARLITGLGLHGDGTPRLRRRVEQEVLPAFSDRIQEVSLEQKGAVLRVTFVKYDSSASRSHQLNLQEENRLRQRAATEENLMVGGQRLDQARVYLEEGDLRRTRLKVGQLLRDFLPSDQVPTDEEGLKKSLRRIEEALIKAGY